MMNTKFRKKPVVISAYQWHGGVNQEQMPPAPSDLLRRKTSFWGHHLGWELETLEGWYTLTPKDWLICGIAGEWYPCKPDIFEATYDKAGEQDTEWPNGFIGEILTLFDRIEIEDDPSLANQRFEIGEKYGLTVEFGERISGLIN